MGSRQRRRRRLLRRQGRRLAWIDGAAPTTSEKIELYDGSVVGLAKTDPQRIDLGDVDVPDPGIAALDRQRLGPAGCVVGVDVVQ